jgi:hypothetical protein
MLKDKLRLRLLRKQELREGGVYLQAMVMGPFRGGEPTGMNMGPAQLEFLNEEDGTWYSVAIYAEEEPRILHG